MEGGRTEAELQGQAFLWNHIFRFIGSMALKCALELNIAEIIHLHLGPISLPDLASALSLTPDKVPALASLMRLLTCSGIFDVSTDTSGAATFKLNTSSKLLLCDDGGINYGNTSMKPFAMTMLDPVLTNPWHALAAWFRDIHDAPNPFELVHNTNVWVMAGADPKFNGLINDAMACDAHFLMTAMASRSECCDVFKNIRTLVDVDGGTGATTKALCNLFPDITCKVLELPHVVAEAVETDKVKFVQGDMFQSVPSSEAVLLKWVLHDWSDEDCVKILKNCREAIMGNDEAGKVILIDMIINCGEQDRLQAETQYYFDLLMMTVVSGKERTQREWSKLFKLAGFQSYKVISTLGLRSLVEIYP